MSKSAEIVVGAAVKLALLMAGFYVLYLFAGAMTPALREGGFWRVAKIPLLLIGLGVGYGALRALLNPETNGGGAWWFWGAGLLCCAAVFTVDASSPAAGALLYVGASVIVAGFVLIPRGFVALLSIGAERSPRSNMLYDAHFAREEELKPLLESYTSPQIGAALLLAEYPARRPREAPRVLALRAGATGGRREMGHALVVGPTRSGKGLHLITQLLTWEGSAVVVDIKGEMFDKTAGARSRHSRVMVLDPSGKGVRYDPFRDLSYSDESLFSAAALVMQSDKDGANAIFGQRATAALFAALRGAKLENAASLPYVRAVTRGGLLAFARTLAALRDEKVTTALTDFLGRPASALTEDNLERDRFLASSWQNLITKLRPLFSEGILTMTSGHDFSASDLVKSSMTLYLIFRESELESTGQALALIELAMINALIREFDLNPDRATVPLLLAFDEAGRVPVPKLPQLLSTVAGRGMSALVYIQDLAQLESSYGRDGAATVRNNCHTQMYYPPRDSATAKFLSTKLGLVSHVDVSHSESVSKSQDFTDVWGGDGLKTTGWLDALVGQQTVTRGMTVKWSQRELATAYELERMSPENVLLFVSELPPVFANRFKPFARPELQKHLGLTTPSLTQIAPFIARPISASNPPPQGRPDEGTPDDDLIPISKSTDDWHEPPEEFA